MLGETMRPVAQPRQRRAAPRWLAELSRGDRPALAVLVLLPIALYLPPLFFSHLELPGDDLVQNLPLRELAGQVLRGGHLPAWNPFIWSGTPLLAGWNAGALFPGTFAFAVLPIGVAWFLNLAAAPLLSGIGMHLWLRRRRLGPLPALLGALVFTYTGFMSAQIVHLGLVQGTALMPFALLGIDGLDTARARRSIAGWVALLGVSLALTVLAGDPRAITSTVIAAGIYALGLVLTRGRRPLGLIAGLLAGAVLGAALSAIQWLPGLAFLSHSQRSSAAYSFFGSGSLGIEHIGAQLLVPFLLGGNANFGLPNYVGTFNLPEVTIGCGLVALVAALLYLAPLGEQLRERLVSRVHHDDGRHLATIYVLGVTGLVLSTGSTTALGHLFVHIPLFGNERLQNRNAVLFDFALAVLVGYLIEDLANPASKLRELLRGQLRLLGLLPPLAAIGVAGYAMARPLSLQNRLHDPSIVPGLMSQLAPYLWTTIALAVLLGVAVLLLRRLSPRRAGLVFSVLVLADVAMYTANASYAEVPTAVVASHTALGTKLQSYLGPSGRFGIFDPAFEALGSDSPATEELGLPDLNVIQQHSSVEGYGSIVSGAYQDETDTHVAESLDQTALRTPTFDVLDLRTLVTLPIYFDEPIPANAPIPLAVAPNRVIDTSGVAGLPPFTTGPWKIGAETTAAFELAQPTVLRRATIVLVPGAPAPTQLTVFADAPDGRAVARTAVVRHGQAQVNLGGVRAVDLRVVDAGGPTTLVAAAVVVTAQPNLRLLLDGALQGDLSPPHWRYGGQLGKFSVWENSRTVGLAWLQASTLTAPETSSLAPGSVHVLANSFGSPQRIEVQTATAATLVRSEAYAGGWTARVRPANGGPTKVLAVRRFGLVQAINLPKGNWVVTWRYAPASLLLGLVITMIGLLALLTLAVWFGRRRSG